MRVFLHQYRLKGALGPDRDLQRLRVALALTNQVSTSSVQRYSQVIGHEVPEDAEQPPAVLLGRFVVQDSDGPVCSETPVRRVLNVRLPSSPPLLNRFPAAIDRLRIR